MAQKTAKGVKDLGTFSNTVEVVKMTWDFSKDGGATSDTYVIGDVKRKILILDSRVHVETQCTSTGSATMIIGISGGDTDAFMDTTSGAVASLVDDYINTETAGQNLVVASGAKLECAIGTEAMNAGKVNLIVRYMNID